MIEKIFFILFGCLVINLVGKNKCFVRTSFNGLSITQVFHDNSIYTLGYHSGIDRFTKEES